MLLAVGRTEQGGVCMATTAVGGRGQDERSVDVRRKARGRGSRRAFRAVACGAACIYADHAANLNSLNSPQICLSWRQIRAQRAALEVRKLAQTDARERWSDDEFVLCNTD